MITAGAVEVRDQVTAPDPAPTASLAPAKLVEKQPADVAHRSQPISAPVGRRPPLRRRSPRNLPPRPRRPCSGAAAEPAPADAPPPAATESTTPAAPPVAPAEEAGTGDADAGASSSTGTAVTTTTTTTTTGTGTGETAVVVIGTPDPPEATTPVTPPAEDGGTPVAVPAAELRAFDSGPADATL